MSYSYDVMQLKMPIMSSVIEFGHIFIKNYI